MEINSNPPPDCTYQELDHTSEIGLSLEAETAEFLFICAAQAMFQLIQPQPLSATKHSLQHYQISLSADDPESLLVDWLSELLYLYETTHLIFNRYHIHIWEPTFIEATITGTRSEERPAKHIKAVTYHQLEVVRTAENWQARVFFDI